MSALSGLLTQLIDRGIIVNKVDTSCMVCLCRLPHNEVTPYCTWRFNDKGDTYAGEYFRDLSDAEKNYDDRVKL